ncbi:MAG: hypothetical protein IJH63_10040 [Methanobrevibacter sp.]|nr:hypothetical protein [Methanosphaera sp.]MBR0371038.1 hypothetical protein [Methanobrevibacter sp.]
MLVDDKIEDDLEEKLAIILARIYLQIPWSKISVKSAHKFFIDRIRASANAKNFKEFLDILTRKVSVTFVKLDSEDICLLEEYNEFTMGLIRKESLYVTNYALEKVDELKKI